MPDDAIRYPCYRFPPVIISHAVWLYYRFSLRFREVEDLLAHRGIAVQRVIHNLFAVGRHRLRARHQRLLRTRAFGTWNAVAGV